MNESYSVSPLCAPSEDQQLFQAQRTLTAATCLLECAVHSWGDGARSEQRLRQMAELLCDAAEALDDCRETWYPTSGRAHP